VRPPPGWTPCQGVRFGGGGGSRDGEGGGGEAGGGAGDDDVVSRLGFWGQWWRGAPTTSLTLEASNGDGAIEAAGGRSVGLEGAGCSTEGRWRDWEGEERR
jgi:hypothetical protein